MKKIPLFPAILSLILSSCLDPDLPDINGMWQLKTIRDDNQTVQTIDTIFYSFQQQAIFSYTVLNEKESEAATTKITYGYIDFPERNQLHILLDETEHWKIAVWKEYLGLWEGETEVTYGIVKSDSKNLILRRHNKTYDFIKY